MQKEDLTTVKTIDKVHHKSTNKIIGDLSVDAALSRVMSRRALVGKHESEKVEADEAMDYVKNLYASFNHNNETLKTMVITQLAGLHEFQQRILRCANSPQSRECDVRNLTKLTNSFVQLAHLLQKLNGENQQKVVVEHVEVNSGGQAVIGNIEGGRGNL